MTLRDVQNDAYCSKHIKSLKINLIKRTGLQNLKPEITDE